MTDSRNTRPTTNAPVLSGEANFIPWQAAAIAMCFFLAAVASFVQGAPELTFAALILSGFVPGVSARQINLESYPVTVLFVAVMGALCGLCAQFCLFQPTRSLMLVILGLISGMATGQTAGLVLRSVVDWAVSRFRR